MASRFIVLAAALVACQAGPIWYAADNGFGPEPVLYIREGRSPDFSTPSFAYGIGTGLSYDFGGIKHNSGYAASFQSGNGQAYGSGIGGSDGQTFARGIGYANANPAPQPIYRTSYPLGYSPYNGLRRDYGNNFASSVSRNQQNIGNYGTSIAQAQNSPYGSSATSIQHSHDQSTISTAGNHGGISHAFSSAQGNDGNSVVAASHNGGGVAASTAQSTQQQGAAVRQAGAFSFEGVQAAQSHVFNNY